MATYGRIGFYTLKPGSLDPLIEKAREVMPAPITQQPGFMRYAVLRSGPEEITSLSVWESREQAEASAKHLVGWMHDNSSSEVTSADNLFGETIVSEWTSTSQPKWGRIGVNRVTGSMQDAGREAANHFIPELMKQPGFCTHTVWRTGDDQVTTFTTFDSKAQGVAAGEAIAPVEQQHLAPHVTPEKVVAGDILWMVRQG